MTVGEAHIRRVGWASWPRLLLVYDLVMLAVGVPTALFAYDTVHDLRPSFPDAFAMSWTPASVVVACLVVGVGASLLFLVGPLAELCISRWTRFRLGREWRLAFAGIWLLASLLVVAYVGFTFFAMPITLMD